MSNCLDFRCFNNNLIKLSMTKRKVKSKVVVKPKAKAAVTSFVTTATVSNLLKGLLKHTSHSRRVNTVKSHIREVEAVAKKKAPLKATRIGACLEAFKQANKRRTINQEIVADFLYARLLNRGKTNASAQRLAEMNFNFEPSEVPMQLGRPA